jgi:excisionase family DNA binding protein
MKSTESNAAPHVLAYTLDQVAEMLNVSRDTLDDMLTLGEIQYIHVGKRKRILVEELLAYFRRRKVFEAKQILAQAGTERRCLTPEEIRRFDSYMADITKIDAA